MLLHAITRKVRQIMPLVFMVLIVGFVKFLKELPIPHETQEHRSESKESLQSNERADKIPKPPSDPEPKLWLLAHTNESSICYSLAAKFHGWDILLLGVTDTSAKHSRCHLLDVDKIKTLCSQYELDDCESASSKIRTMTAILFMLKFHPDAVYFAPSLKNLRELERPRNLNVERSNMKLLFNSKSQKYNIFQAHHHFGCNTSKSDRTLFQSENQYQLCSIKPPLIQASPIFTKSTHNICDDHAPTVVLGKNEYSLFSFNGAVILKEALWVFGLIPLYRRVTYGYLTLAFIIQKLLWLTGNKIELRYDLSNLNELLNFKDGKRTRNALKKINRWQCLKNSFQDCLLDIITLVFHQSPNITKGADLKTWLQSLAKTGYTFPEINTQEEISCNNNNINFIPLDYSKHVDHAKTWRKVNYPINNIGKHKHLYEATCPKRQEKIPFSIDSPWTQFGNILLIIVFNNPHYETIPYIELLYQPFFPNILFCGPEYPNRLKFPQLFNDQHLLNSSFITYDKTPEGQAKGSYNYRCTTKAMQMLYHVEGYLTMADDLIVWIHDMVKFPKAAAWFLPQKEIRIGDLKTLRECKLGMCDFFAHWNWWEDYQVQMMEVLTYMKEEQGNSLLLYTCYQELIRLNGAEFRANGAYSDIYYIPSRLSKDFVILSELFLKHEVFLEIAIPTILRCLEPPENVQILHGTASWDPDKRDHPWEYFAKKYIIGKTYYHPCKWGFITSGNLSKMYEDFLCNKVLPFMFDPYARLYLLQ